jgi:hypothetical protein
MLVQRHWQALLQGQHWRPPDHWQACCPAIHPSMRSYEALAKYAESCQNVKMQNVHSMQNMLNMLKFVKYAEYAEYAEYE